MNPQIEAAGIFTVNKKLFPSVCIGCIIISFIPLDAVNFVLFFYKTVDWHNTDLLFYLDGFFQNGFS